MTQLVLYIYTSKAWYEGVIQKLKCNGISGILVIILVNAGVPQGCGLGSLLLLVYISGNIYSEMRLFEDDSSLLTCVQGIDRAQEKTQKDLGLPAENGV